MTEPRALYNEIDRYAASWLENLIRRGLIANGDVACCDVRDLRPKDLAGYNQVHLFAGIGVWSYGLRRAGIPDSANIWTFSEPCQPFSAAGKGLGFADERYLRPFVHHLVSQCRPNICLGEQVASKDGLSWLDVVQSDMEGTRYAFGPSDTCSAGFGAPHVRQRLRFSAVDLEWLAHSKHRRRETWESSRRGASSALSSSITSDLADANNERRERQHSLLLGNQSGRVSRNCIEVAGGSQACDLADSQVERQSRIHGKPNARASIEPQRSGIAGELANTARLGRREWSADAAGCRERSEAQGVEQRLGNGSVRSLANADGRDAGAEGLQRSGQHGLGTQDGVPMRSGVAGLGHNSGSELARPGPTNGFWSNADWLLCRDGKWRPVEPGTFPLAHGVASRVGRLRAYGNAVDGEATTEFCGVVGDVLGLRAAA